MTYDPRPTTHDHDPRHTTDYRRPTTEDLVGDR